MAREDIDGVHVVRVPYFPRRWECLADDAIMPTLRARPWTIVQAPFLVLSLLLGTRRAVRDTRAVALNPHWIIPAGLIAATLRLLGGPPYVLTVHGADAYTLRGRRLHAIKQLVVRRAAAVAPVSDDIATTLRLPPGTPVLRMGVDVARLREQMGQRQPQGRRLVYVGRLADKKGVDVLLDALAEVPDAELEVLGDGPARRALEERAQRLGIDERVHFAGRKPRAEVLAAYRRAHAVVIPSRVASDGDQEGTPVVLAEAMAAGVPVVASDLGGLGECIEHGRTGLLVPPDDASALAATIQRLLSGQVDADAIGRHAARAASERLDIHAVGSAYDRLLQAAAT